MPCSCQKPQPDYPESEHWGPVLWTILHALAQKGGKALFASSRDDERRQWILLLQTLPKMIPCAMCREHSQAWIQTHPVAPIKTISYDELGTWLVDWVYDFHEAVNARVGKPSFDKRLLGVTYDHVSVPGALRILKPFIETAIRLSGITLMPWNSWVGYVRLLSSYYGL
jgi:hypothetical protein